MVGCCISLTHSLPGSSVLTTKQEATTLGTGVGIKLTVGVSDGAAVGTTVGVTDGAAVGTTVGASDGATVGTTVGATDGAAVGTTVGATDGAAVGQGVIYLTGGWVARLNFYFLCYHHEQISRPRPPPPRQTGHQNYLTFAYENYTFCIIA